MLDTPFHPTQLVGVAICLCALIDYEMEDFSHHAKWDADEEGREEWLEAAATWAALRADPLHIDAIRAWREDQPDDS
ncbi:MAG: hypothetical protein ABJF10_11030 [Chthoniobacter sp.]|uniref:hypothetical protein n=1 Tax=Chthoniobacter sp. TaxID=2510640 RepID=UPI0032A211C3